MCVSCVTTHKGDSTKSFGDSVGGGEVGEVRGGTRTPLTPRSGDFPLFVKCQW